MWVESPKLVKEIASLQQTIKAYESQPRLKEIEKKVFKDRIFELEKMLDRSNVIWRPKDVKHFCRNFNKPNKKAQEMLRRADTIFGKIKKKEG
jgi:hypothetical protein